MTADQLKHAMRALHLSDKQLAQLTGKHDRTVRRWVSGEIGVPHLVARLVGEMMEQNMLAGGPL